MEEQLDAEQLESLKKYQERKQQKQNHAYTYAQVRWTTTLTKMQMSVCFLVSLLVLSFPSSVCSHR